MRKKIVAGNWKMNKTLDEGTDLVKEILLSLNDQDTEKATVIFAPPFIHLQKIASLVKGKKNVQVAAQNCHAKSSGAFTGEISAAMVASTGAQSVLVGHSERRQYFHESYQDLTEKVQGALANKLTPVFCCGEPLEVREAGNHFSLVEEQLRESLFGLTKEEFSKLVIAYEPVWAIGTGKTASSQQAQEMHQHIRKAIENKFGKEVADATSILYGGSCNAQNARELFSQPDVDGGLIGGASLKAADFLAIIRSF